MRTHATWMRLWIGCGLLAAMTITPLCAAAEGPDADAIVRKADNIMDPGDFNSEVVMTVQRPGEEAREYRMHMQGSGAEKMLITFSAPARNKGQAYLRNGDNMWLYLSNLNKTLRIPDRDSFAGGDFSNHDVLNVRLHQEYSAERLADETVEGVACFSLQLTAKDKTAPYASIRYWVAKNNFWPVKRVFYTVGGQPFKTLLLKSKQCPDRPDTYVMSNVLEKEKITEMSWSNLKPARVDPKIFTENYLTRRR